MAAKKRGKKASGSQRRSRARPPSRLSARQMRALKKAGDDADELALAFAKGWRAIGGALRVPGVTPAALERAAARFARALDKERALASKYESALASLRQERMRAGDEVLDLLFKANGFKRAAAAHDPAIATAFAEFDARWARHQGARKRRAPEAPAASG